MIENYLSYSVRLSFPIMVIIGAISYVFFRIQIFFSLKKTWLWGLLIPFICAVISLGYKSLVIIYSDHELAFNRYIIENLLYNVY